jgi:hypothetical protein
MKDIVISNKNIHRINYRDNACSMFNTSGVKTMITHEDAINYLKTWLPLSHYKKFISVKNLYEYITQQEKKDMLLEMYRDFHYGNHDAETDHDILRQIKALEEELK